MAAVKLRFSDSHSVWIRREKQHLHLRPGHTLTEQQQQSLLVHQSLFLALVDSVDQYQRLCQQPAPEPALVPVPTPAPAPVPTPAPVPAPVSVAVSAACQLNLLQDLF